MMLKFLANTLEQLDLALDQLAIADTNYKRFTLMLVDNVVELTLHRHAQDISNEQKYFKYSKKPPYPPEIIQAALGQSFEAKAKFAQKSGLLTPIETQSIVTLHSFRNEVYHQGIAHEPILPAISLFYFKSACHFLGNLKIGGVTWRMGEPIPHRAKKYLGPNPSWTIRDSFPAASPPPVKGVRHDILTSHSPRAEWSLQARALTIRPSGGPTSHRGDAALDQNLSHALSDCGWLSLFL